MTQIVDKPNVIYVLDTNHVKRSDDGGTTWVVDQNLETQLTWNQKIAFSTQPDPLGNEPIGFLTPLDPFDLLLTDMQFEPTSPLLRFAVGVGGARSLICRSPFSNGQRLPRNDFTERTKLP